MMSDKKCKLCCEDAKWKWNGDFYCQFCLRTGSMCGRMKRRALARCVALTLVVCIILTTRTIRFVHRNARSNITAQRG